MSEIKLSTYEKIRLNDTAGLSNEVRARARCLVFARAFDAPARALARAPRRQGLASFAEKCIIVQYLQGSPKARELFVVWELLAKAKVTREKRRREQRRTIDARTSSISSALRRSNAMPTIVSSWN